MKHIIELTSLNNNLFMRSKKISLSYPSSSSAFFYLRKLRKGTFEITYSTEAKCINKLLLEAYWPISPPKYPVVTEVFSLAHPLFIETDPQGIKLSRKIDLDLIEL